jgi:hypothetical protein
MIRNPIVADCCDVKYISQLYSMGVISDTIIYSLGSILAMKQENLQDIPRLAFIVLLCSYV